MLADRLDIDTVSLYRNVLQRVPVPNFAPEDALEGLFQSEGSAGSARDEYLGDLLIELVLEVIEGEKDLAGKVLLLFHPTYFLLIL